MLLDPPIAFFVISSKQQNSVTSSSSHEASCCTIFLSLSGPTILPRIFAVSALLCPAKVQHQYSSAVFTPQFAALYLSWRYVEGACQSKCCNLMNSEIYLKC